MVIGVCTIQLELPAAFSLKDKRQILQSLIRRIHNEFNVSIAEVDKQDIWQNATLGVACVSTSAAYAHGLLTKVVAKIEDLRMDLVLLDYEIEML
jgi:uncharacterized protein YlxP (DUF503 family)